MSMNYDILIAPSINRLSSNIVNSLQAISANASPSAALPAASLQSNVFVNPDKTSPPPSRDQRGLTLVELMIAMVLGLFLLGGIMQIFISSRQTYTMQEGLSRLQENGRFAIDFMARDIRMAGFLGCAEAVDQNSVKPNVVPDAIIPVIQAPSNADIIMGQNAITNNWSASACGPNNRCLAGTDAISMRHADSCGGSLTASLALVTDDISIPGPPGPPVPNSCGINVNDTLIIADCIKADIFRAATANPVNAVNPTLIGHAALNALYSNPNAELFLYRDHSYYIRTSTGGRPSLWMLDNTQATGGNNPVELVEGIEDMQILYGVDTEMDTVTGESKNPLTGDDDYAPNYYVPAGSVVAADWAKVVSVHISLLVATIDEIASQPLAYTYNGVPVTTPSDRKLRRAFTTTIALRNRVP